MKPLDTLLQLFQNPIRNGWLIALLFLAIGSIPKQLYTGITNKRQRPVVQYNTASTDTTPSDVHKYSLWMRFFTYWWQQAPRSLLEHVWKSMVIPFLITYSVGETLCFMLATVEVTNFVLAAFVI
ncbi:MAG: hypothetical protein H0W34_03210 [Pyrinomonadaceae bacterium]|nr:hypothetical protein [Pyrinomonadaceae bacterium]